MDHVIELNEVTRRFGDLTAVDGVTLSVQRGEIVGLLGHNGAGKTTLIRVINGLLRPDGGSVRVLGLDPVTDGQRVRGATGVLTEYPALDEYLTTRENLEVYARINGLRDAASRPWIDQLLERLGLAEKADVISRGLSAGLKQRVALARALVHDPQVLLLDEPTTNMDPVAARDVRELVLEAVRVRGRTCLLSTHNLAEAEQVCDRVAILRRGQLLASGRPAELRRAFGGQVGARITTTAGGAHHLAAALTVDGRDGPRVVAGDRVEVTDGRPAPELVAAAVAAGVEVHRVEPIEPTLEDLYVRLHHGGSFPATSPSAGAGQPVPSVAPVPPPPPPPGAPSETRVDVEVER